MSEVDLNEIKRWLKRGDRQMIANEVGVTPQYVSMVLGGHHPNHDVIERAIDKAIERKSAISSKMERLKQLSV